MISVLPTTTVTVVRKVDNGVDAYNSPVRKDVPEDVAGVLPAPSSTDDLGETRPDGTRIDMIFHFPKTYTQSLKGCIIEYGGRKYRVSGDPQPYFDDATPDPFNRAVPTELVEG